MTNDFADTDLAGITGESQSATAPANGLDVARASEIVNDLRQMSLRDVVGPRDLVDRDQLPRAESQVHQDTKTVVAIPRES